MPRTARKQSGSSVYHIVNRGAGKQIIFENDADRAFFMKKLEALLDEEGGTLLAWCLMGNHFHLLHDAQHQDERCLEAREAPLRGLSDEDARRIADELLEGVAVGSLKGADRQTRDKALSALKARGLSVRQIQRLTGISLGVISKAGKEMNT